MPLQPNVLERFLIRRGVVPSLLVDLGIPLFQLFAMLGAMEIGFFRHLEEGPATVPTLAQRTDASERGIARLVQILEPLGYIEEENGRYRLTDLARDMPIELLGPMATYLKSQAIGTLSELDRGLREAPEDGVYGWEHVQSGEVGRGYQASMRWLASGTVDEVVDKISLPDGAERMLDVGGSHGLYTVGFCEKYPELTGSVLDWEIGLKEARKTLDDHPEMGDRIDLVERDFEEEALPEGYDFAFLGNIIHGIDPTGNRALFDKLAQATTDRGMIGVVDQFAGISGSQFSRAVAGLVGLNLFLFSGGRSYEADDVKQWLADVGFTQNTLHDLNQPGFSLLVAWKDEATPRRSGFFSWSNG